MSNNDNEHYYKDLSDVEVKFKDGTVETFRISAGPSIGGHLAREASNTGILSLWNRDKSWGIPLGNIRSWEITAVLVEDTKP